MKVLVIGKGGREHALVWRLHQSETVWKIFCATGNPGIDQIAEAVPIAPTDVAALVEFAKSKSVDLTIVGPDDVLATGIVDHFTRAGLKIFGPTAAAAQLESSKSFAKTIMREAGVPTADFEAFDDAESARRYVKSRKGSMVVKADGLALGKGVIICHDTTTALEAVADAMERRRFGAAGNRVIVEEFLTGEEISFFALCDGENAIPLGTFQDHKAIFDGDRGPNTGGMGAYSPVPQFGPAMEARVMREVVKPTLAAMNARGTPFRGVLFVGLMTDGERINVIEFNVRFGDPECEALMMRLDSDLAENLLAAADGNVANASIRLSPRSAVAVVLASGGYPGEYKKGIPIRGLDRLEGNVPSDIKIKWAMKKIRVKVFHSGTAMRDGQSGDRRRARVDGDCDGAGAGDGGRRGVRGGGNDRVRGTSLPARHRAPRARIVAMPSVEDGIAALQAGELVVYPTETFYAIGADAFSSVALRRLFRAKGREPGRPVGLIAADTAMAFSVAREIPIDARRLADAFWPGPLTIVMPARDEIAAELTGADGVGVRVSPNPVARALSAGLGRPITATSANLSGEAPASTLEEARAGLG